MNRRAHPRRLAPLALGLVFLLQACVSSGRAAGSTGPPLATSPSAPSATRAQSIVPPQSPVPAESHPPGDIPDSTVYVPYASKGGHLTLKVPEGWSRVTTSASGKFVSNLNSITIAWTAAPSAPTVASVKSIDVPQLRASLLAFRLQSVKSVSLPGGSPIETVYEVNSKPNAVTGKQYRLVVERFAFYKGGREAFLSLSSAVGSDNVDPWRIVSESFRWL